MKARLWKRLHIGLGLATSCRYSDALLGVCADMYGCIVPNCRELLLREITLLMFSVANVYCISVIGYVGCALGSMSNGNLYFGDDIIVCLCYSVPVVLFLSMSNIMIVSCGWQ